MGSCVGNATTKVGGCSNSLPLPWVHPLGRGRVFRHLTYADGHQRGFQWVFNGSEWLPLTQALHLLGQVAGYEEEANVLG